MYEVIDVYSVNDKRAVFAALKECNMSKISFEEISRTSGVRVTLVRSIMELLIRWGYIEKVLLVDMGPKYRRYTYRVLKDYDDYTEFDADEEYSLNEVPVIPLRRIRDNI